jgi:hypothetical protein
MLDSVRLVGKSILIVFVEGDHVCTAALFPYGDNRHDRL